MYAELICRSNFSFLRGASHPEELVATAARLGLQALALTDGDGLYGVVKAHLAMVHDRYLAQTSVQRMAAHLRLISRLEPGPLATELFHHPDLGSSDLVVVTRDVAGLFSLIAGTLAAHGVNIISAQIATRADGIAIDTFQVNDPTGEALTSAAQWTRALDALGRVLTNEQSVDVLLERRRAAGKPARA